MTKSLKPILPIAQALCDAALSKHRKILQHKHDLETRQNDLDRTASVSVDADAQHRMTLAGADSAWRDWVSLQRATLQREAAMIRARELDSLPQTRLAMGRRDALAALVEDETQKTAREHRKKQDTALHSLALLKRRGV
jgi:hypothetical protein